MSSTPWDCTDNTTLVLERSRCVNIVGAIEQPTIKKLLLVVSEASLLLFWLFLFIFSWTSQCSKLLFVGEHLP